MLTKIASSNKNAVMEMELEEKTKVIKLLQTKILTLQKQVHDLEVATARPPSGLRLSPLSTAAY